MAIVGVSKSLTAISKLSVDKDLVADIENGGVENNDDVEEDEGKIRMLPMMQKNRWKI